MGPQVLRGDQPQPTIQRRTMYALRTEQEGLPTFSPSGSSVVAGKIDENGQSSTMDSEVHVGSDRRFLPSVTGVSLHYAQRLGIRVERCYHASDTQWCGCKWVVRCHVGLALTARDRYRLGRRSVIYVFSRMWSWRRWLNVQSGHRKDGSPSGALCRTHGTEKVRCPRHRDSTRGPTRRRRARKGSRPGCACSRMRSLMRSEAGCGAELLRTSTSWRGAQRLQVNTDGYNYGSPIKAMRTFSSLLEDVDIPQADTINENRCVTCC